MTSVENRYATGAGGSAIPPSPAVTPHYGTSLPNPPNDIESARNTRCATGVRFITTIHGILNIVIIIALVCVLICAGVSSKSDGQLADSLSAFTNVKVSAFHTRNAVLVFAAFGLVLILVDTILHMTALINRFPSMFDLVFIIIMLVFAGIYLILGCCAAAWQKKMTDTLGSFVTHKGAPGAAAFFLFVTMIAIIVDFVLRLIRPVTRL